MTNSAARSIHTAARTIGQSMVPESDSFRLEAGVVRSVNANPTRVSVSLAGEDASVTHDVVPVLVSGGTYAVGSNVVVVLVNGLAAVVLGIIDTATS